MLRRSSRLVTKKEKSDEKERSDENGSFVLRTRKRKFQEYEDAPPVYVRSPHQRTNRKHLHEIKLGRLDEQVLELRDVESLVTPDKEPRDLPHFSKSRCTSVALLPDRPSPLPVLGWACPEEVWSNLLQKEQSHERDRHFLDRHPALTPRMRAVLLDWLMEVCEVYRLHRETLYLALDYFDRFLATQTDVCKSQLQLIGITALFIAAKTEEIYPPKLTEFAYVTDGACTEEDIVVMELNMLQSLKWALCPVSIISWLGLYLQIACLKNTSQMLLPQYSQDTFLQISQLLDLCVLDMGCLDFTYSTIAASALYHFTSLELVYRVSGLRWEHLSECVRWMVPFAMAVREAGRAQPRSFTHIPSDNWHNIQTHTSALANLDRAQTLQAELLRQSQESPVPAGTLTPPHSGQK